MSSMIPDTIQLPGGGGDPSAPPVGPDQGGDGPDSAKVISLVQDAIDSLDQAKSLEKDPGDQALIADLVAKAHKFIGSQQDLVDKATGAGHGEKLLRKSAGGGAGAGY